jgi:hypothetical protein
MNAIAITYNPIEQKYVDNLMEIRSERCPQMSENNVFYCSSHLLQERKPDNMTEEQWGKCPFYRLDTWCTNDPEGCCFYVKEVC